MPNPDAIVMQFKHGNNVNTVTLDNERMVAIILEIFSCAEVQAEGKLECANLMLMPERRKVLEDVVLLSRKMVMLAKEAR